MIRRGDAKGDASVSAEAEAEAVTWKSEYKSAGDPLVDAEGDVISEREGT